MHVKNLLNDVLTPFGVHVLRSSSKSDVVELIGLLRPHDLGVDLVRIGGDGDGGYLVPDDLEGVGYCFSPGVAETATFEAELEKLGIPSFLADYSVSTAPIDLPDSQFLQKFVGAANDERTIEINTWLADSLDPAVQDDLLLQMDIEGSELETILALSEDNMRRFRIMIVEFHDSELWRNRRLLGLTRSCVRKVLSLFEVCHVHPNNCCGTVNVCGVRVPSAFEVTFLRKDRVKQIKRVGSLPHRLDQPNEVGRRDISLGQIWQEGD